LPNDVGQLRCDAARLRELARVVTDERNQRQLLELADRLDTLAAGLDEKLRGTK